LTISKRLGSIPSREQEREHRYRLTEAHVVGHTRTEAELGCHRQPGESALLIQAVAAGELGY
jgi:hypothetical protein